jgi:RNA polymerase sigma-70 factor (ECF subfamily)
LQIGRTFLLLERPDGMEQCNADKTDRQKKLELLDVLLRKSQNGDKLAFEKLYGLYRKLLMKVAYARTNDYQEAEDAVQEVMLIAWRQIATKTVTSFWLWTKGILINATSSLRPGSAYRRQRFGRIYDFHSEPDDPGRSGGQFSVMTPLDPVQADEESDYDYQCNHRLEHWLSQLKPFMRKAIEKHYIEGLTAAEAAKEMGISVGSCNNYINLGRKKLKEIMPVPV